MNEQDRPGSGAADPGPESTVLDDLQRAFEILGLLPVLIGGHAMNMYCGARLTWDIDLLIEGTEGDLHRCERMFAMLGYKPDADAAFASSDGAFVRLAHPSMPLTVDIMAARSTYEEALLQRARMMDDLPFRVATPEDLMVLKLVAGRPRDQRDLAELAAIPGLDWAYVERWARAWGAQRQCADLKRGAHPDSRQGTS